MAPVIVDVAKIARTNGHVPPPSPPTGGGDGGNGEPTPRRPIIENVMLATLFFIAAEVMLFGGLIFSFWIVRLGAPVWPPPLQPRLPVGVTGVNTLILLGSSLAVIAAGRARRRGDRQVVLRGLGLAAGLGGVFLAVQGYEWGQLVHFGLTVGSGAYGTTFYTLIGAHGIHVLIALVWLLVTLALAASGRFLTGRAPAFKACAMYWHFVVALWPVLYVSVYLL